MTNTRNIFPVMEIINTTTFNGHPLNVYGDFEEPLFRARDIAEMIDYMKTNRGYYNTAKMLQSVDKDEKIKGIPNRDTQEKEGITICNTRADNLKTPVWFLTEQGLYEVLFQSRKPIAKEFKKAVKAILKEIRLKGYYMAGEMVDDTPSLPNDYYTEDGAERHFIDTLTRLTLETDNLNEKERLNQRLRVFMENRIYYRPSVTF